ARPIRVAVDRRRRRAERASDPAAVEELRPRPVESPEIALAAEAEIEHGRALDEEGALLVEGRFDVAEVDHGRIDLDLAEVGIHRRVEREVRAETDFRVGAD